MKYRFVLPILLFLLSNTIIAQTLTQQEAPKRWNAVSYCQAETETGIQQSATVIPSMVGGPYLPVLVLLLAAVGFALAPLLMAWIWARKFSPQKTGASKNAVYECGLESEGDAWIQFKPGYYLYAIIFLVFDVEAIFLLPFAVSFTGFTIAESIAMLVFLLLLVEGLVWAYQKRVLVWT